ncbi:hypothetical protein ACFQO1_03675 [Jejudonia soesokkakensis]|uniref:Uncharacterized protein n=1 Tax=Jejudonia soesokkakensis TaxID=1323432 RepID=A0ABW2MT90_9FLAO
MKTNKKQTIDFTNIPLDSSLGHLAYGDQAFKAWRELKNKQREIENNEQK